MIGGFTLVAYPAVSGASGIMTFIVNQDGVVNPKDLGPKTARVDAEGANAMKAYHPDSTWIRAEGRRASTLTARGRPFLGAEDSCRGNA